MSQLTKIPFVPMEIRQWGFHSQMLPILPMPGVPPSSWTTDGSVKASCFFLQKMGDVMKTRECPTKKKSQAGNIGWTHRIQMQNNIGLIGWTQDEHRMIQICCKKGRWSTRNPPKNRKSRNPDKKLTFPQRPEGIRFTDKDLDLLELGGTLDTGF